MDDLKAFLQNQTILQISPAAGEPWIANVLMGCESPERIYFAGSADRLYGQQLLLDPTLAFATAWVDESNHGNRKGVQGVGKAMLNPSEEDIAAGIFLHNTKYPEFKNYITMEWAANNRPEGVWVIKPRFIKFWNDELYGSEGSKIFHFEE